MEILIFKNDEVIFSPSAMSLPEVKDFIKSEKCKSAKFVNDFIKFVWFMYNPGTPLNQFYPKERYEYISTNMFKKKYDFKKLESEKEISAFIKFYIKTTNSISQRHYESIKADMENLLEHIHSIPFTRKVLVKNKKVTFEHENETKEAFINVEIEMDNSDEKAKAMKLSETLYDLESRLREKVRTDMLEASEQDGRTLLERQQS